MKDIRSFALGFLTLVLGLGLMSGSLESRLAKAALIDHIPAMKVTRLGNYRGQFLNVIYAVGSRPFFAIDDSNVTVTAVRAMKQIPIDGDSLDLPAVEVAKEGMRASYNLVVFVVSREAGFSWINADGSGAAGQLTTSNNQKTYVKALTKNQIEQFQMDNGLSAVLEVGL